MITLTTKLNKRGKDVNGYMIYMDGELVSQTPGHDEIDGGDPIYINKAIHLCGRSDKNKKRHFDGSLSKLSIFDYALNKKQIKMMYDVIYNGINENIMNNKELQIKKDIMAYEDKYISYVRSVEIDEALTYHQSSYDMNETYLNTRPFNLMQYFNDHQLCYFDVEMTQQLQSSNKSNKY